MFLIDVPPPTVSGVLHMGHVFSYCHMDFIARYQRQIRGQKVIYPFCFDNNGLPTERLAQQNGIFDQNAIIKFSYEQSIAYSCLFQKISMGYSADHYSTFSETAQKLAVLSFQDLVKKGLAYRAHTEYFYCPKDKVSVSQNEIDDQGRYERTGEKVEVRTGDGWFIDIKNHLPRIRAAIDQIEWKPLKYKHRLLAWLDDLKYDWSISRERKFGIPIPGETGQVFDTWHTSSLSPMLAYSQQDCHQKSLANEIWEPSLKCPIFDARFQAHDIIRTWALFTIVKSLYHNDQIPWKTIIISGHALDGKGHKISKTAGNFVHPETYIDRHTADGVRYWSSGSEIGSDTKINEELMSKGRKLVTKITNAKRFIDMKEDQIKDDVLLKEWTDTRTQIDNAMDNYDWPAAISFLTMYFWHRFCDVHIEASKQNPVNGTLREILADMMRYFSVFLPSISLLNKHK